MIEDLVNVADFERVASEKLDAGVLGYFAGGAGDEETLRDNVAAWGRWRLRPRMLAGHAEWSARGELLGAELSMPSWSRRSPSRGLVDPEGETAMARAAAGGGDGDVPLDPGDDAARARSPRPRLAAATGSSSTASATRASLGR